MLFGRHTERGITTGQQAGVKLAVHIRVRSAGFGIGDFEH